jgi:hypothetical protein
MQAIWVIVAPSSRLSLGLVTHSLRKIFDLGDRTRRKATQQFTIEDCEFLQRAREP